VLDAPSETVPEPPPPPLPELCCPITTDGGDDDKGGIADTPPEKPARAEDVGVEDDT
jgi:hypothetical protein